MINNQDIPDHWEIKTIDEVCAEASLGGTPARSNNEYWGGEIPWISSGAVRGKYTTENPEESITKKGLEESSTQIWKKGTVLVAMHGRGTIGRSAIAGIDTTGNQSICGLNVNPEIMDNEFLYYWLQSIKKPLAFKGRGATASRQNLNQGIILDTKVPVPPLDEQKEIVASIEAALDTIDSLSHSVGDIKNLTQEYEKSLLASLFTNNQTSSKTGLSRIPKEEDLPSDWDLKTIGDIVDEAKNGGTPKRSQDEYWEGEIDWLSSGEVKGKEIYSAEETITKKGLDETSAKIFPKDSILVAMYGATRGQSAILREEMSGNQAICCLSLDNSEVTPEYTLYYLKHIKPEMASQGRGGGQKNINQSVILNQKVPVPPLDDQKKIVDELESVDMNQVYRASENIEILLSEYRESVLNHAFRPISVDDSQLDSEKLLFSEV